MLNHEGDRELVDRYKPYLLPGVAALVLLAYFVWTALSGSSEAESTEAATPATAPAKAPAEAPR